MPRRNRSSHEPQPLRGSLASSHVESHPDGDWIVRTVAPTSKVYRCPGCDHEVGPGIAHIVAWPADETGSVGDRRHWHSACWQARDRRRPTRRRY